MFYCKDCGYEFSVPGKAYETHNLSSPPYEAIYFCPNCKSEKFYERNSTHCRCCGAKLANEGSEYCCPACRIKGEKLRRKELKRRRSEYSNPINIIVRETEQYNKENGTSYSYGQFVALVKPSLLGEKHYARRKKEIS